jgi:adenosylmethionine-8-amino-7-oxononanoate aminotransferase
MGRMSDSVTAGAPVPVGGHLWHPFTQMADFATADPFIVEAAEGNWLIGADGRRLLDGVASLWCNVHGHRVPSIDNAIRDQLNKVAHSTLLGSSNVPAMTLAERLVGVAPPGLNRVFFAENGASAVEVALKMAYQHWQHRGFPGRQRFIAFDNAYHGDTLGAVSVGGIPLFHEAFRPLLFDVLRAPSPYFYRCPDGHATAQECGAHALQVLEDLLIRHEGEVCAVILEPLVQGAAGMIMQPPGFLASVRELCDRHDVLLILDEVATGFGRTGTMFACEQEAVAPNLLVLGKGISAGYLPLSAVLATDHIFESFLGSPTSGRTFFHGHTYTGNQLACVAALANLGLFRDEPVLEHARERAAQLAAELEAIADLPCVGEVRQRGLMVGVELVADRAARAAFPAERRVAWNVCLRMRERGVLIRPLGDVVVLMPPVSIRETEVTLLCGALRDELSAILMTA